MKVVWLRGTFPADQDHLEAIAERVKLTVYGTQYRPPHFTFEPRPPTACASRAFRPMPASRRGHQLWGYPGLHGSLTKDDPDVVHVTSEPWGVRALQAARWARRHPHSALVIHGCDRIWWHGSALEQALRRRLSRWVLSVSKGYAAENPASISLARSVGLPLHSPSAVIHTNPRDPAVFRPPGNHEERTSARKRLGLPQRGIGIGFLGRLDPEKGVLDFLDALGIARSREDTVPWAAIAGDGSLREEVEKRASETGSTYLGPLKYPARVAEFYRAVEVFVVPSYTTEYWDEQSPRSIIEAMMSGCVVVGSSCGAIPAMLGDTGVIFPERDTGALAEAIVQALHTAMAERLCQAARERAVSVYSGDAVAERLVALWQAACSVHPIVSS